MASTLTWSDLELHNTLGEGKAGVVQRATLRKPFAGLPAGTSVAIKRYKSWVLEEAGQFERIIRELETGRRIDHPNLLKTYTLIQEPSGTPAIVMRYYNGETLQCWLDRKHREKDQPVDEAFAVIRGIAAGLQAIHQAGCIHRDLKPANIMLVGQSPVIMDFGVIRSAMLPEQTTVGNFLGTIRYAAPEYLFGQQYDHRADIYSFGAILFEIFGDRLFMHEEDQWAKVIVNKGSRFHGRVEPAYFKNATRKWGLNVTHFARTVLDASLANVDRRSLDLPSMVDACDRSLWKQPFHFDQGRFAAARNEGDSPALSGELIREQIVKLRSVLSRDDWEDLELLLYEHYWDSSFVADFDRQPVLEHLHELGLITVGVDSGDEFCEFKPALRWAYRYGLLDESSR